MDLCTLDDNLNVESEVDTEEESITAPPYSPISSCIVGEASFDDGVLSDQNECDMDVMEESTSLVFNHIYHGNIYLHF